MLDYEKSGGIIKFFFILLLGLFLSFTGSSQPCLPQGITFSSQSQIDSFPINYPNCTEITGSVNILGSTISNLNGLNMITSINSALWINYNNELTSLTGLNALTSIGNSLYILNNTALTSLTGLNSLNFIGGTLGINVNPVLTNITALNELTTSDLGFLCISDNDSLKSLNGLDNIDSDSIQYIYIKRNHSLTTCEVKSICDYLANPYGVIDIEDNATGCNSQQEVEDACAAIGVESLTPGSLFSIYPNPAFTQITIETSAIPIDSKLSILNLNGQKLITRQITEPKTQLDISTLPNGVYIVHLTNDRTVEVRKIIKQ
ncbi:MAG: T9SS type A sorting domain-containing protein [bacterium]